MAMAQCLALLSLDPLPTPMPLLYSGKGSFCFLVGSANLSLSDAQWVGVSRMRPGMHSDFLGPPRDLPGVGSACAEAIPSFSWLIVCSFLLHIPGTAHCLLSQAWEARPGHPQPQLRCYTHIFENFLCKSTFLKLLYFEYPICFLFLCSQIHGTIENWKYIYVFF